jgi:hypothetical protein
MTLKTYKAKSSLSLSVPVGNGTTAYVSFATQVNGCSVFKTTDTTLQGALESYNKFGKLYVLDSAATVSTALTYPNVSYSDKESSTGNVLTFTQQSLTEQEKQQARQNIGAATEPAELGNVLRYSSQVLTTIQKDQARQNINAEKYSEIITDEEMDAVLAE